MNQKIQPKKSVLLTALCFAFAILLSVSTFAQVTVTGTTPVSSASYSTVNAAFAAINAGTHQGAVVVTITANTTEPATAVPLLKSGAPSSYSSILIKPGGTGIVVNSAATPTAAAAMIELWGADNVTIDGDPTNTGTRQLTFQMATIAASTAVIRLASTASTDGATGNTIKNCNIIGSRPSSTDVNTTLGITLASNITSLTTAAVAGATNTTIQNNNITRALDGIFTTGSATALNANLVIKGNVVGSSTPANTIGFQGIILQFTASTAGVGSAIVDGNDIQAGDATTGIGGNVSALQVNTTNAGCLIKNNVIHDVYNAAYLAGTYGGSYGIFLASATSNASISIFNNIIRDVRARYNIGMFSSLENYGIIVAAAVTGLKIDNNTIYMRNSNFNTQAATASACIYCTTSTAGITEIQNNILINTIPGASQSLCIATQGTTPISGATINKNCYFNSSSSQFSVYNSAFQVTLAAWRTATGKDAASVFYLPVFRSSTDLHIDSTNTNNITNLFQTGNNVATNTTDIDGQSRNNPPCIGADEFNLPPCPGTPTITSSVASLCSPGLVTLTGTGYSAGSGATYQWEASTDNITYNPIGGATNPASVSDVPSADPYYYRLNVTCSSPASTNYSNVITIARTIPTLSTTTPGNACGTSTVNLAATAPAGNTLTWYAASTFGAPLGTGPSFTTPVISSTTNYYVDASKSSAPATNGVVSTSNIGLFSSATYGMYFSAGPSSIINSVDIYPATTGSFTVNLLNASATIVDSRTFTIAAGDVSTTVRKTLALNFSVPAGSTGWQLSVTSLMNLGNGGYVYSSPAVNGFAITGNSVGGNNLSFNTYYMFFNWQVSQYCVTGRTAVAATINTAPSFSITTGPQTVCNDGVATLAVTSTLSNYNKYTWTPTTGLFSDALGTVPYVAGQNLSTVYARTTTVGTRTFTCNAQDTITTCTAVASTSVNTRIPVLETVTSDVAIQCSGRPVTLISFPKDSVVIMNQDFESGLAGWTLANTGTGGTPANANWNIEPNPYVAFGLTWNSGAGNNFLLSVAGAQGGITKVSLTSPSFSTVGYTGLSLSYLQDFNTLTTTDSAFVEVSTNGITWTTLQLTQSPVGLPAGFVSNSINLNAYLGQSAVLIRFRYSSPTTGQYWGLDNIVVSGTNSTLSGFTYSWSSSPAGSSGSTDTLNATLTATTTYSCLVTSAATGCTKTASATVTLNTTPVSASISGPLSSVCYLSNSILTATANNGCPPYTYAWSGGIGALNTTNDTVSAPTTTTYSVTITDFGGATASASYTVTALIPTVSPLTSTSTCGPGSDTLRGTPSLGTVAWYGLSTGGPTLGSGSPFVTPVLSSTTTYWAQAGGNITEHIGLLNNSSGTVGTASGYGVYFNSTNAAIINSVNVYVSTAGTFTLNLLNNLGATMATYTTTFTAGQISTTVPVTVPVNFSVPAGATAWQVQSNGTWYRIAGSYSYPYTGGSGLFSLTGNTFDGNNPVAGTRFHFFDWNVTLLGSCPSAFIPISAPVTTPPAISLNAASVTSCDATVHALSITSNPATYNTYVWSPVTGLYTNSSGTTPYLGGSATTVYAGPTYTTSYTVSATQTSGLGCHTTAGATAIKYSPPTNPLITAASANICANTPIMLHDTSSNVFLFENFNSGQGSFNITNSGTGNPFVATTAPYTSPAATVTSYSIDGSNFIQSNPDISASLVTNSNLISPNITLVGALNAKLTFQHFYEFYTLDSARVEITTNGGASWSTLKDYKPLAVNQGSAATPANESISLNAYVGQIIQIRFHYYSPFGYIWAIDNVKVSGAIASPGYTWSPAASLYTNSGATTAYTNDSRQTIYAKPTSATIYTATVLDSTTGCTSSSTDTITTITRPTADITGASTACHGVAETYSIAFTGTGPWNYTIDTAGGGPVITGTTATSPIFINLVPAATKTIKVTALSDAACTAQAADLDSQHIVITTNCAITWVGTSNTSWSNPNNWSPILVPNSCLADVTIPAGTPNQPVISATDIQVGNITIGNNVAITLTGHNLSVCKNFTGPSSSATAYNIVGTGKLIMNGSSAQTYNGYGTIDEMAINNASGGVSLANVAYAHISIYRGLHLQSGNLANSNSGAVILLSNSADTVAWLNDFASGYTGTFSGKLTVQRKVAATGTTWQHQMSAPVNGSGVTFYSLGQSTYGWHAAAPLIPSSNCSEDSINWTSPYSTGMSWHESNVNAVAPTCATKGWYTVAGPDVFSAGIGYSLYLTSASKVSLGGSPNTGAINVSGLTNSSWTVTTPEGHVFNSGWSLIGNPYPSSLDMTASRLGAGFDNQIQVYQPTGAYKGTYQPQLLGAPALPVHLAAFQGFMIHKTAAGGTSTFSFVQSERTTAQGSNYHFYKTGTENQLAVNVSGNGFNDMTRVEFNDAATNGFDPEFDANKFHANAGQPTIYTLATGSNQWMGINVLSTFEKSAIVPMGFEAGADGSFTFNVSAEDLGSFDASVNVYLEDKQNPNNWINLRNNNSYTFTAKATDTKERFALHFEKTNTAINEVTNAASLNIFSVENKVLVDFSKMKNVDATVQIYNILGQELSNETHHASDTYIKTLENVEAAYVIVKVKMADGSINSKKLFITK